MIYFKTALGCEMTHPEFKKSKDGRSLHGYQGQFLYSKDLYKGWIYGF